MTEIFATISGFLGMAAFNLSYQFKKREQIILVNTLSRFLYVLQYVLLGAFSGAALDIAAAVVLFFAGKRETPFIKKHLKWVVAASVVFVIAVGLVFYQNVFSLIAIAGILFETGACWFRKEKTVRWFSILGAPCWLIYNLRYLAVASAVGNVITMISIGIAIWRYDIRKEKQEK